MTRFIAVLLPLALLVAACSQDDAVGSDGGAKDAGLITDGGTGPGDAGDRPDASGSSGDAAAVADAGGGGRDAGSFADAGGATADAALAPPDSGLSACEWLNCGAINMSCNEAAGACQGCSDPTYVQSANHCYPPSASWGGPCTKSGDCPGTGVPDEDTFCMDTTGGYCYQSGGPDYTTEGSPCAGDSASVSVAYAYQGSAYDECLKSCSSDSDCRPGYYCEGGVSTTAPALKVCMPIWMKCQTYGCNDASADQAYYCEVGGAYCFVDACASDPCATVANSTFECTNLYDGYTCGCAAGYVWDVSAKSCRTTDCRATDLGAFDGVTAIDRQAQDTCADGTAVYDPGKNLNSCTQFLPQLGNELVYKVTVPAATSMKVTVTPVEHFDPSVYVITDCQDWSATTCDQSLNMGSDRYGAGQAETVTIVNSGSAIQTYYIVADAYGPGHCGMFDLSVTAP